MGKVKYTQEEKVAICTDIGINLKEFENPNGVKVNLFNDSYSFIPELKKLFREYIYNDISLNGTLEFTEIDKNTYKQIENREEGVPWQLYRVFSLTWELTGDINKVAQTNKNIVQIIEQREKAQGLGLYLKENWTQYYKSNP